VADLKLVSLFTGAGGLDYGFEAAGFEVRVALEMDKDCCATLRKNRPWTIIEDDIHKVGGSQILEAAGLKRGDVDILVGGPPCQPFSKSGYWANGDTKRLKDPRADTLYAYMRCVDELLPEVFFLENVHGINYSGKEEGFRLLQKLTEKINKKNGTSYGISWQVLDAADFGVPQQRTRFFLVSHREGRRFEFPSRTHQIIHGENDSLEGNRIPLAIVSWDAIGHLGEPPPEENLAVNGKWGDLLPSIPEGENYLWHTSRKGGLPLFGWRTRYWSFLLKLAKARPSWTIQAQPGPAIGPFHWKNRRLSVKEMAALQTFPKNIEFAGSRNSVQRQIGNAVPSLLSEILARSIAEQLFDVPARGQPTLGVAPRRPIPDPEPIQPVPEKYLKLVGHHPDHPGAKRGEPIGSLRRWQTRDARGIGNAQQYLGSSS
jgi:DNA (cytosine-5)-methyltransferase 1